MVFLPLRIMYLRFLVHTKTNIDKMCRPNFGNLKTHILPLSEERFNFNVAKIKWESDYIVFTMEFGQCSCSQRIKVHCYMINKNNEKTTHVGNICVEKCMGIDARNIFNGLRKIRNNAEAPPNIDLMEYTSWLSIW